MLRHQPARGGTAAATLAYQLVNADSQGDSRQDEAKQRHPQVSQHAVKQLASSLEGGLEGDASSKLASGCTPGSLDVGEP